MNNALGDCDAHRYHTLKGETAMRTLVICMTALALIYGAATTAAAPTPTCTVGFENWKNLPLSQASWQSSTLSAKEMLYPEGGTIPYRLILPQPCVGTTWSITLQYDFADNPTGVHFIDFLTSYNAYETSVDGHTCDGHACNGETTFPIPSDGTLGYQLPGVFRVENGAITSASAYSTTVSGGVTTKFITLTGTATPGADVILLFGAHASRDFDWGTNKGARQWPSGTASVGFLNFSGISGAGSAGHTNIKISDNIIDNPSQSDLSIVALGSPDPVNAGQTLTYSITAYNSGPLSAYPDTVADAIPAGTMFVSATAPAGWTVTTPPVGGTGTVRWFLQSAFGPAASATFGMVVAVNANASGTVENTATLGSGTIDAYQTNNSSHVSTTIIPLPGPMLNVPHPLAIFTGPGATSCGVAVADSVIGQASATDAFGAPVSVQRTGMPGGNLFPVGTVVITYSATDGNGIQSLATQVVTVIDNTQPVVVCPANITVAPEPAQSSGGSHSPIAWDQSAHVTFAPTVSDNCPGVTFVCSPASGSEFPTGITTVNVTATDASGNQTRSSFTVTVDSAPADSSAGAGARVGAPGMRVDASQRTAGTLSVDPSMPLEFRLAQNAPNPFAGGTQILFSLPVRSHVRLGVFDVAGREVVSLSNQVWEPGAHMVSWSGSDQAGTTVRGGVYFIHMDATSESDGARYRSLRKMIKND